MLARDIGSAAGRVLSAPRRMRFLLRGGPRNAVWLGRFLARVVPLARRELRELRREAKRIPDPTMRQLALSSLEHKAYHVAGGCILATFLRGTARDRYVRLVAPLESIYDYLDSLCDRHPATTLPAIRQLHLAVADALDPSRPLHDYYAEGPPGDDRGYLRHLVERARHELARVDGQEHLMPCFAESAALYAEHQALKHSPPEQRAAAIAAWHTRDGARSSDLTWWEFAAAAGSQLQVYAPLYVAFHGDPAGIGAAYAAYFPHLAALHVLLDSFIDQAEDREHGELNWVGCYDSPRDFVVRAGALANRAREGFESLAQPRVHDFALRVLSLFYLSHPKIRRQRLDGQALALLAALT